MKTIVCVSIHKRTGRLIRRFCLTSDSGEYPFYTLSVADAHVSISA